MSLRSRGLQADFATTFRGTYETLPRYYVSLKLMEADMGFGRGALLWLLGIPLPIIIILALFMHH
jgi:hypothetical protein